MNVVQCLHCTPAIALERFGHDPTTPHRDPERERAGGHAINFVRKGTFRVRTSEAWRPVAPDRLFVTSPGLEFSCAHDDEYPDDECLSVLYTEDAIESLHSAGALPRSSSLPGEAPVLELTNRQAYLRASLEAAPNSDAARLEAAAGALYWTLGMESKRRPLYRATQLSWYAARVDRAKELMRADFAEPLSLSRLAREVGMSLYPFARVFSELEGEPPHRFLVGTRLSEAARRLREGERVTQVCFAVGFGSLSHFISAFRRRYGASPSQFRVARAGAGARGQERALRARGVRARRW